MTPQPVHHIASVIDQCSFPGLTFEFSPQRLALRVHAWAGSPWAIDNHTGVTLAWNARWWLLSVHMIEGEIVQTAFKAVLTALEHEVRERFHYQGGRPFDPHLDIGRLVDLSRDPHGTLQRTAPPGPAAREPAR